MNYTADQSAALKAFDAGSNLCVVGAAGTGKSTLLQEMQKRLRRQGVSYKVVSPTALAAVNVGGVTMHSFAGLGFGAPETGPEWLRSIKASKKATAIFNAVKERWAGLRVLFIDEVGMVSRNMLDLYDTMARAYMRQQRPFGGLRVVVMGDFFQLPPICRGTNEPHYAFEAAVWPRLQFVTIELTQVVRQSDAAFVELLDRVRMQKAPRETIAALEAQTADNKLAHPVRLVPINALKASQNQLLYDRLPQGVPEVTYVAEDKPKNPALYKALNAQETLTLKPGARVMLVKNIAGMPELFNGKAGTVRAVLPSEVVVDFDKLGEVTLGRSEFLVRTGAGKVCKREQIPLQLAYYISIHKSQGMTIEELEVDFTGCFGPGMVYTALSRARSLDGLVFRNLQPRFISTNHKVLDFYKRGK